ncbi:hypothetical protein CEP53_002587 [Fusarium sp. AF-6]|nr:hypothetical protein CEP53_002587 [Fusarium sp. AF-6]
MNKRSRQPILILRYYSWIATTPQTVTMKNLITYTLAATLAAGATAHQHQHVHNRRHAGSKVQKRGANVVTEYVVAATETVYELAGKQLGHEEAKAGLDGGNLIIVGESNPTYQPPAAAETTQPEAQKQKAEIGAQFYQSKEVTSAAAEAAPTTVVEVVSSVAAEKPKSSKASSSSNSGSSYSGSSSGSGVNKKFESGKVPCSTFPSEYGAEALDWLQLGGWSGIQYVPDFTLASLVITEIHTAVKGDKCKKGSMCSYACPAGYQKTQWPSAQGSTKESVGGLYCNDEGFLELTRDGYDTLCEAGVGGVSIQNDLDEDVVTCRTDYPGTENMVIPALASAGGSVSICNPEQEKYYIWNGSGTSAQYYVNKKGYSVEDACVWDSPKGKDAGNWAPVVLGVGQAADGITYISIFQNLPTSDAPLDFNIEITGDVNSECSYIDGAWTGGDSGCTTGMKSGGKAIVRYF